MELIGRFFFKNRWRVRGVLKSGTAPDFDENLSTTRHEFVFRCKRIYSRGYVAQTRGFWEHFED